MVATKASVSKSCLYKFSMYYLIFLSSLTWIGVVTCLSATRPEQKLYIPEEDDTKGFQPGDKIKVLKDVKLWHVNGFRDEGISAQGMEGEVVNIWLRSRKNLKEVTVNLPLVVQFTEPTSFKAHFDFDEVEKLHWFFGLTLYHIVSLFQNLCSKWLRYPSHIIFRSTLVRIRIWDSFSHLLQIW